MAIGTSRGAYFDDEFHHAAGINTDPSVDNNVLDPDIDPARQTSDSNEKKPSGVGKTEDGKPIHIHLTLPDNSPDTTFQDVTPEDIEDHTTFQGVPNTDVSRVMRQPSNAGPDVSREDMYRTMSDEDLLHHIDTYDQGVLHGSLGDVHEGLPHLEMARRQGTFQANSNEGEPQSDSEDPFRQTPFTDHMSDEEFYHYGLEHSPGEMTPEQEQRWARIDRHPPAVTFSRMVNDVTDAGRNNHMTSEQEARLSDSHMSAADAMEALNSTRNMPRQARYFEMQQRFVESDRRQMQREKDAIDTASRVVGKSGNITMKALYDAGEGFGGQAHAFGFMDKEGNYGNLNLTEKNDGKLLYVDWIGNIDQTLQEKVIDGKKHYVEKKQNEIAPSEIRSLIKILKEKFPKAEEIEGFRISGARKATGRGGSTARLRIRPKSDMPSEQPMDLDLMSEFPSTPRNRHRY